MNGRDPKDEFEARLRESLQRDGEHIRPHGDGLSRIRERTSQRHSSGRRWWTVGAIGLATATAVTGAFYVSTDVLDRSAAPGPVATPAVQPESSEPPTPSPNETSSSSASGSAAPSPSPSPSEPEPQPTGSAPPPESPPAEPPPPPTTDPDPTPSISQLTVPVYYLGETTAGPRLFREFHSVDSAQSEAVTALNEMFSAAPRDPDYSSPWAPGSTATSVEAAGGQITVDLGSDVLDTSVPRETADLMMQQLVYTVQAALQSTDPVQILVDGQPVSDISGAPTAEPLARADAADVQAMTWIITPSQGATVSPAFMVTGVASSFEGNVVWQLVQDGKVVRESFTTAAQGQTFAEYSFMVKNVPAGDYTLRVFQTSPMDGSEEFVDTKDITVE